MWTLSADPDGPTRLVVGRVEPYGDATAVHVSVVEVLPAACEQDFVVEAPHLALDLAGFEARVAAVDRTLPAPVDGFHGGYAAWEAQRGGLSEGTVGVDAGAGEGCGKS